MDAQAHPRAVTDLVNRLIDALTGRGLVAEPFGANMVWVVNRAADLLGAEPRDARKGPNLRQTVICRPDENAALGWWWVWTGRDGGVEYEWLCPGLEITMATDAIQRVLMVRSAPTGERAGA